MSIRFADGIKAKRSEVYSFDPKVIKIDQSKRGRYTEVPQEAFDALVADIKENGQLSPIIVRRLEDDNVEVVAGFTRLMACLKIQEDDPTFKVRCEVHTEMDDRRAFAVNMTENTHRNDLTVMDKAHIAAKARLEYGMPVVEIAKLLGTNGESKSITWVNNLLTLAKLPQSIRDRVAKGTLAASAAIKLSKVENQEEVLAEIDASEASQTAASSAIVREKGIKTGRSLSDLRKLVKLYPASPLAKEIKKFFAGEDNRLEHWVSSMVDLEDMEPEEESTEEELTEGETSEAQELELVGA